MKLSLAQSAALTCALLLACAAASAHGGSLVVNGSFSTPASSTVAWGTSGVSAPGPGTISWGPGAYGYSPTNISGWTFSSFVSGSSGAGIADNGSAFSFTAPPSGDSQVAFLQQNADMTQDITGLVAGETYTLSFDLEGRPTSGADSLSVTIGGVTVLGPTTAAAGVWTAYEESFTATGSSEMLEFSTSDPSDTDLTTAIDAVEIVTPEPGSLLLMATGLLGLGGLVRRKMLVVQTAPRL